MSDILKEIDDWKASFTTYMTPAEVDGYEMVEKCEDAIKRLRGKLIQLNKFREVYRKELLDDLREWNKDPEKDRPGFRYAYFAADIDAYEKDQNGPE